MDKFRKEIESLTREYNELGIEQFLNWAKYNNYSIVHHSTSIEGSILTKEETDLLLDEDITAKGKPLSHHHMVKDHYKALLFLKEVAKKKTKINTKFLCALSGIIMENTGSIYNTVLGSFDSSKGDLRLVNVAAGETRFPDFKKVPDLLTIFYNDLEKRLSQITDSIEILETAFDCHFNLVSIHPFADGNGRISRLLMNYVQLRFGLPLSIVFNEDKADYYKALVDTREKEDVGIFRNFMFEQHIKYLKSEIDKVKNSDNKTNKILDSSAKRNKGKGPETSIMFV